MELDLNIKIVFANETSHKYIQMTPNNVLMHELQTVDAKHYISPMDCDVDQWLDVLHSSQSFIQEL